MSNDGGLLNPEEVDFLLQQGMGDEPETSAAVSEDQEVTMRGDLDQINLADIFQTLAMSKMEGVLRIRNPLQHREIYFKDGLIRCLVPPRLVTRRLGQWLIKAGLISGEELREALLQQQEQTERKHLGQILVENGWVDEESLENIALSQITEDLFGVFTWRHGSFEFYKGPASDPLLRERLDVLPQFEVNGVLLEVARRSDEWAGILDALGSLDDVPVTCKDAEPPEDMEQSLLDVYQQVDGSQSFRDLAESSLLGLFEGATSAKILVNRGLIELAEADHLLEVAEHRIDRGELRRAQVLIQTLHEREDLHSRAQLMAMAELLKRCNESRLASYMLLEAARNEPDATMRLELAGKAFKLNRRDLPVAEEYYQLLCQDAQDGDAELADTANALVDALTDLGEIEQALRILDEQSVRTPGIPGLMGRRAIALHKLGRSQDAVEAWLEVAQLHEQQGDRERLIESYEAILKIDHEQRDVAKALKQLKLTKLQRMRGRLVGGGVLVTALVVGVLWWQGAQREAAITAVREDVDGLLARIQLPDRIGHIGDGIGSAAEAQRWEEETDARLAAAAQLIDTARGTLRAAVTQLGESSEFDEIAQHIAQRNRRIQDSRNQHQDRQRNRGLEAAWLLLTQGEVADAAGALLQVGREFKMGKRLDSWVVGHVNTLIADMDRLARELPFKIVDPPTELTDNATIQAGLEGLREAFGGIKGTQYRGLSRAAEVEELVQMLPADRLARLTELATGLEEIYGQGRLRLAEYERAAADRDTARRLEPLFVQAREHEANFRFREALEAYRRLVAEHPRDDEIKAHFQEQLQKYATIQRLMEALETATREGDFVAARNQYRALQRSWQEIPFDQLVLLPLSVHTRPPGAQVLANGVEMGTSPMVLAYRPGDHTEIRVERDGFLPEVATVHGDGVGRLESLLVRSPGWSHAARGSIQAEGIVMGGQLLFTDRSGHLTSLELVSGETRWTVGTDDLSGLLTRPVPIGQNAVAFGSVDGPFRAFQVDRGMLLWEAPGVATDCDPAVVGNLIAVVTTDQRLVVLRANGEQHGAIPLPQPVQGGLLALDRGEVFVAGMQGLGLRISCQDLEIRWQKPIPKGVMARPTDAGETIAVCGDTGEIALLDKRSGQAIWTARIGGEVTRPACRFGDGLFINRGDRLVRLDLQSGRKTDELLSNIRWTSGPGVVGRQIVIGAGEGHCSVLDPEDLTVRYRLHGAGRVFAAPLALPDNGAAVFTEGRRVLSFPDLP